MESGFLPEGLDLTPRLTRIAHAVGSILRPGMHQLASHGDHFVSHEDTLASPIEPIKPWGMNRWDSEGTYYDDTPQ